MSIRSCYLQREDRIDIKLSGKWQKKDRQTATWLSNLLSAISSCLQILQRYYWNTLNCIRDTARAYVYDKKCLCVFMREGLTDEGPVSNYIFIKQRG